jgi:hypothetical protein
MPAPDIQLQPFTGYAPELPTRGEAVKQYDAAQKWAPEAIGAAQAAAAEEAREFGRRVSRVGGGVSKLARLGMQGRHTQRAQVALKALSADLRKAGMDMSSARLAAVNAMDVEQRREGLQAQATDLNRQIAQQQAQQGFASLKLRQQAQWVNYELQRAQTDARLQTDWLDSFLRYSKQEAPSVKIQMSGRGGGKRGRAEGKRGGGYRALGEPGGGAGYRALGGGGRTGSAYPAGYKLPWQT